MADNSKIEWTDATWGPTTGCDRVSPGCDNCYALGMAKRLKAMGQPDYQTDGDPKTSGPGFGLAIHPHRLDQPLRWKKPRRIFVNSMSDLFHDSVPTDHLARVFAVMATARQHTYQILTKRHARMRTLLSSDYFRTDVSCAIAALDGPSANLWPLPNVWLGVSVENQQWANIRIPALLDTPAAVRFLSCEPLLGPVDLVPPLKRWAQNDAVQINQHLHWVIVGGESGHGARPMHPDWARTLRDQSEAAGVAYLFKQWGAWAPTGARGAGVIRESRMYVPDSLARAECPPAHECGAEIARMGKHAAGRELDGRTWDEYPAEVPA